MGTVRVVVTMSRSSRTASLHEGASKQGVCGIGESVAIIFMHMARIDRSLMHPPATAPIPSRPDQTRPAQAG